MVWMPAVPALLLALAAPAAQDPRVETLDALGLTLRIPAAIAGLAADESEAGDEDVLGAWVGKLGGKDVWIDVARTADTAEDEPSDVTWRIHDYVRGSDYDGPEFDFSEHRLVPGPYGHVPYAALLHGPIRERGQTAAAGYIAYLGGIADKGGWLVTVTVEPNPAESERKLVLDFLQKGVAGAGAARDPRWSEERARQRWDEAVPNPEDKKSLRLDKLIRTAHYLVLTNSSGGDAFAKQMELNYAAIQKTFPFPEVAGRKLMPVFLFQTADEYCDFYARTFETTLEEARESKGVAWRDFYATWYEAPKDPVHIHEATHQIFANRLALDGAGSWYQEGVAEYIETKRNDRNDAARRVKDGTHTPLKELFALESLLGSSEDDLSGDDKASLNYKQAALLIEFLRESRFGQEKFLDWLHAMGNVRDNDLPRIEAVFRRVYGAGLDELERAFQDYCRKR